MNQAVRQIFQSSVSSQSALWSGVLWFAFGVIANVPHVGISSVHGTYFKGEPNEPQEKLVEGTQYGWPFTTYERIAFINVSVRIPTLHVLAILANVVFILAASTSTWYLVRSRIQLTIQSLLFLTASAAVTLAVVRQLHFPHAIHYGLLFCYSIPLAIALQFKTLQSFERLHRWAINPKKSTRTIGD